MDDTHHLVAPDRPGYGATPGPAVGPTRAADLLGELSDRLELGSALVVGHSYGAAVAARLAQIRPDAVAGLVLVCPAIGTGALTTADRLLALPLVGEAASFAVMRGSSNLAHWSSRLVSPGLWSGLPDRLGLPADRIGAFTETWRTGDVWRSFTVEQRGIVAEMEEITAGLDEIGVPVTLVGGGRDRLVRPEVVRRLAAALPGATVRWCRDAGHLLPLRYPAVVADAVRRSG